MRIRPYPAWGLLASILAVSAWRIHERPGGEYAVTGKRVTSWASLARMTPEELDRGLPHRYEGLAAELKGAREVGYFSEQNSEALFRDASTADGFDRIQRYYMAQGLLPPSLLRLDAIHPLVVVDCATPEQAERVLRREGLTAVRDFGRGLVLARPAY